MAEDLFINIDNDLRPFEDYNFLRAEGIKLIEKLSGKVWTDYNAHDPGITLLEALCYALTDLGYRTSFEIKDILAPDAEQPDWGGIFYTSKEILPSNPVTITDYRKLIIDTDGVKNAWIDISNDYEVLLYLNAKEAATGTEPGSYELAYSSASDNEPMRIKGLYKVTVDYEEDVIEEKRQELVNDIIREKLNGHRNLCEDFLSIRPVDYEKFTMETEVQVREGSDIELINAKIFQVIHNFFSPSIKFYTLDQMLMKGYTPEEIFEGPSLKNGFIDTNELEKSEKYMDIHLSDIVNLISDIPGVIAVKKCVFPIETQSAFSDFTQWITNVKEKEKAPKLDLENSTVTFIRSGDRHRSDKEKIPDRKIVNEIYYFLQSEIRPSKIKGMVNDIPVPAGEFMNIAEYYPFQYSLPACYGMQEKVTDQDIDTASVIERAIRELKSKEKDQNIRVSNSTEVIDAVSFENFGKSLTSLSSADDLNKLKQYYISYQVNKYELRGKQILQLRGFLMFFEQIMADYLSQLGNITQLFSFDPSIKQTYFPQALQGIHDLNLLIINMKKYHDDSLKLIESNKLFLKRRNTILDHLLARFGENSQAYSPPVHTFNQSGLATDIDNKVTVLSDYVAISSYRGSGFDFANKDQIWDTGNVAGMKRRICRLLGIKSYKTAFITTDWISLDKVEQPGGSPSRTKVVIKDPDKPENILLETDAYEDESEVREVLQYILQSGFDKTLYDIDARRDKFSYELNRRNQEGTPEPIASRHFANNEDLDSTYKKTIDTLENFAHSTNFHVLEHILLRPKMNPQETGSKKDVGGIKVKATDLLSVTNIPDKDFFVGQRRQLTSYNFKITTLKDPQVSYKTVWKLSLRKDKTDIIVSDDDFVFENHIRKRMEHIREVATDIANFEITEKNEDNRSQFKIVDYSKKPAQVLAVSSRSYEKIEDMKDEINSLIKYFSYELGSIDDQESDQVDFASFADPYSFRISLFVPKWPLKFRDPGFRHSFEKAVYMETPSHIYPDVYWLDYKEMKDFEVVYKMWLQEISKNVIPDTAIVNNLINVLNEFRKRTAHA